MKRLILSQPTPTTALLECGHLWTYDYKTSRNLARLQPGKRVTCEDCRLLDVLGKAMSDSEDDGDEGGDGGVEALSP